MRLNYEEKFHFGYKQSPTPIVSQLNNHSEKNPTRISEHFGDVHESSKGIGTRAAILDSSWIKGKAKSSQLKALTVTHSFHKKVRNN